MSYRPWAERNKAGQLAFCVMQSRKGATMSSERLAWVVTNLLEAGLLVGGFLPLLLAAAIVHRQRRPR
jgi:hypothetical protein